MYDPMPGTMLHEQNTPQFGGAGVMRRGDGRVTFVGGSPLKFVPPASKYASLDEWQANEQSRRMRSVPFRGAASPQLVAGVPGVPGIPGAPGPAPMANAAAPAPSVASSSPSLPTPQQSAFLAMTGLPDPNIGRVNPLNAAEYSRRLTAMRQNQERKLGGPQNLMASMALMGAFQGNRENNQFAANRMASQSQAEMDLLKQRQTMEMPASQKAQMDMLAGIASSPNLAHDQRIALAQAAMGLARPGGSLAPDVLEGLKTGEVMPLPNMTGMSKEDKIRAYHEYIRNNKNLAPGMADKKLAESGLTPTDIAQEIGGRSFGIRPGDSSWLAKQLDSLFPGRQIEGNANKQREADLSRVPGVAPLLPQPQPSQQNQPGQWINGKWVPRRSNYSFSDALNETAPPPRPIQGTQPNYDYTYFGG